MNYTMLIAGFGGQGVVLMGQMVGYAAIAAGKHATFYPSYGPEQRGGTANCSVVVSDDEIGSPVVTKPNVLVCFNAAALDKFIPQLLPGGILFVNVSQINAEKLNKTGIEIVKIPVNQLAETIGSPKVANIIMLGAVIKKLGVFDLEFAEQAVSEKLGSKPALLELNKKALHQGTLAVR